MHHTRFLLTLFAVLSLLLAACGGGDGEEGNAALEAETELSSDWTRTAQEFRGNNGQRYAYDCEAGGDPRTVWGTGPYTDDSSVCTAAVHAGLITLESGGRVVIEIEEGREEYPEGEANGIETSSWPEWPGSFDFPAG